MALELVKTNSLTREDWLQARKVGIGGSDIAAIAGLSPWRSPMAVYLDKIGELPSQPENEFMYWGNKLEDIVAEEFTIRTGLKVARKNAILQHPKYPWMLANIDRRIVGEKAGLECKTTSVYGKANWADDKIPDMYLLQCQWYMAVTGYDTWWIAVLIGGNTFQHKEIQRDNEIINYLIKIGQDFWTLVENRTPPEIDGSDSSSEVLSILYPADESVDDIITLDGLAESYIKEFQAAQSLEKQWKEVKDEYGNKLKALLGEHITGEVACYKVNWQPVTITRSDTDALKKAGLYDQYSKTTISRRFTITEMKGE